MKAIRIHSFGDSRQLTMEETPRPSPRAGEVLVAIRSVGVNPVDWKIREGYMRRTTALPFTAGQDFAGEVIEAGAEADDYRPGDRVFGFADGAYAEYAAVATTGIARLPLGVDFETAASLPTPGSTAYQLVTQAADVRQGQTVLIHGAAGSVGSLALQLARHQGARVIATALGRDTAYPAELGAEQVIANDRERFEDKVGEVDGVLDLVGGDLLRRSYRVVRRGGVVATTVGPIDAPEAERLGLRAVALLVQRRTADLAQLAALVQQGVLRVRVAKVLPFPEAKQAQDLSQTGTAQGKVLLRVA